MNEKLGHRKVHDHDITKNKKLFDKITCRSTSNVKLLKWKYNLNKEGYERVGKEIHI